MFCLFLASTHRKAVMTASLWVPGGARKASAIKTLSSRVWSSFFVGRVRLLCLILSLPELELQMLMLELEKLDEHSEGGSSGTEGVLSLSAEKRFPMIDLLTIQRDVFSKSWFRNFWFPDGQYENAVKQCQPYRLRFWEGWLHLREFKREFSQTSGQTLELGVAANRKLRYVGQVTASMYFYLQYRGKYLSVRWARKKKMRILRFPFWG